MGISAEEEEAEEEAEERSVAAQEVAEDEAAAMEEGEELVGGKMRQSPPDEPSATAAGAGVDAPDTATAGGGARPQPRCSRGVYTAKGYAIRWRADCCGGAGTCGVRVWASNSEWRGHQCGLRWWRYKGEREKLDAGEEPAAVAHYS
ncbi:hypothetical protein Vretimale_18479 [Volvox reticuliferus]|nr:hypothetical protein Vretimale_18479 [Volvox reticuliferus]